MWMCLECGKQFVWPRLSRVSCPNCGSNEVRLTNNPKGEVHEQSCTSCSSCHVTPSVLPFGCHPRIADSVAISSLEHSGVEWPDIFDLVWGVDPKILDCFSEEHRKVVADIFLEQAKEEESYDPIEKKLHHIIAELLYVKYRKNIHDYVSAAAKRMNAERRRRHNV